ncbi:hypothetical protein DL768_009507 [Monosporascus sp. mg162]|nr:hypothetical protein DL768_009507 [Monosporascus sp. mg162]
MKANTGPRTHSDYTIGWVCALPKEQTAAMAMLDEIHPALWKPSGDPNNYTLGSIGKHNIVVACLPKWQIGANSAATVATWMAATFPRIKFGLMVGIGGGVPPKVRLGDVVVGTPTGQFPGVVQWDMGKAKDGGSFERTGSLNNPPTALLTALSKLETAHELAGTEIPEYLAALRTKWPRLVSKYLKSDSLEDVLFRADYSHVSEGAPDGEGEEDEEENCRLCDKTRAVRRKPRDASVHYGLIASGNQVIEDAGFRNKLKKDLGGQVLCVEMEAAGLMNNFPCVVIRGICDYADSHKNKDWQEHAAAVAAALAKELLQYVLPHDVEKEPAVRDLLSQVRDMVSTVGADVAQMKSNMERDEDQKILTWLTPTDYSVQHNEHIKTHQEGTGRWLLDSAEFGAWVGADQQTLFCPGMPGAGKTILTAVVVDELASRFSRKPSVGIAYIYFNFWQREEQAVKDLFANILKQLAQRGSPLPEGLRDLFDCHKEQRTRPSLGEVLKVLDSVISVYSRVFVVIDAIDECPTSGDCRARFVAGLFDLQKRGVKVFATSRFIPEITNKFDKSTWLEIRASDDDVRMYVAAQISRSGSGLLRSMQPEATDGIAKAVDGIFLLARLALDSLLDEKLPKDVKAALKNLPKGSKAYSRAYEEAMKRVEHQGPKSAKLAKSVLSWITCARRQLSPLELRHALAFDVGDSELDEENLPEAQDVVSVCAGLVTIDNGSGIIRLVHNTTQEYFERTWRRWFPDAEDDIARACVTYLSFGVFESGFCPTDVEFEKRLQTYQLYDYAAHHWGHHAREAAGLDSLVVDFLQSQAKVEASSQALLSVKGWGKSQYSQDFPKHMTGLHLAAYFGIEKAARALIGRYGQDPEDSHNRTPLSWASQNGHEAVVRLLLSDGAKPTSTDHSGLTPLSWATRGRHEAIVRLLSCKDAATESPNAGRQTPPSPIASDCITLGSANNSGSSPLSAETRCETVVRLLIDKGVHTKLVDGGRRGSPPQTSNEREAAVRLLLYCKGTNAELADAKEQTPLLWAAAGGHLAAVRLLLDKGANIESADNQGQTLLSLAAANGREAIARLLLERGVKVESADVEGRTPLSWAAANGHEAVVRLLLSKGANIESAEESGKTPLMRAAEGGHEAAVRLLLDKGAKTGSVDKGGWAPLLRAAANEDEAVMQLLLDRDTNPELADVVKPMLQTLALGRKLRLWATGNRDKAVMQSLLDEGASNDPINDKGQTILACAAENGDTAVVQMLLDRNAKIEAADALGQTPLAWAAQNGHEAAVRVLLTKGAAVNVSNKSGQTPLLLAIQNGCEAVVQLLLNTGKVDPNWKDSNGRTLLRWAADRGHKAVMQLLLKSDAAMYQYRQTLQGHSSAVNSVAFSPDSKLLVSGSYDYTVRLWDTTTGQCRQTLQGHSLAVYSVAFSPDSKLLASGSYDITVRLWDTTTGQCRQTLQGHSYTVNSVAFSPDSKLLASGSHDHTVRLWDTTTGQCRQTLQGHSFAVYSVAFSPDSKLLASGSHDNTVRLWDTTTGQCRQRLQGHSLAVYSVAFSPDSKLLASGSGDITVRLWDT